MLGSPYLFIHFICSLIYIDVDAGGVQWINIQYW